MALFGRKKVQPLKCRWQDICDLMKECVEINAPVLDLRQYRINSIIQ